MPTTRERSLSTAGKLGRCSATVEADLRLCRLIGLSDGYWLPAQAAYDIEVARRELAPALTKFTPWTATGGLT